MMPVIAWNALHSSRILREAMTALRTKMRRGHHRRRRSRARAARSQHGGGDGAQPAHRLRGHGRDREGIGAHRQIDSPDREGARRADRRRARRAARARAHDDARQMTRIAIVFVLLARCRATSIVLVGQQQAGRAKAAAQAAPVRAAGSRAARAARSRGVAEARSGDGCAARRRRHDGRRSRRGRRLVHDAARAARRRRTAGSTRSTCSV